jgi:hypothetical protein
MDEYPYHQITATFAGVGGTDPAWNDGHYLCLSDMAGEVALASSLRLYQNNDVMDGFVCVRHAGKQHNIRVSRRLRPDMGTLAVGATGARGQRAQHLAGRDVSQHRAAV